MQLFLGYPIRGSGEVVFERLLKQDQDSEWACNRYGFAQHYHVIDW